MKYASKLSPIVRSSFAPLIAVGGVIFLTGCSDKEKIAEQERTIEAQKQEMEKQKQEMEKAAQISEIKGKLVAASVKGDSFLYLSIAEQLQKLDGLDDNYLREKLGHEAIIKSYTEGVSGFLAILEDDSASRKDNSTKSSNPAQALIDLTAHDYEVFAKNCNQLSGISKDIEKSNVKSSLANEWKQAENGFYSSKIVGSKISFELDMTFFKESMSILAQSAAQTTELAQITEESPWDLHTTGGNHEALKEMRRKSPKKSDCTFDRLLSAISQMDSSGLKDIREALLRYYRELANVYAEVEAPASIPWGKYISYIRDQRDKVVEKGDVCMSEFSKFKSSSKAKKSTEIAQELINALPSEHVGDLQKRLDQVIAKEQAKPKEKN